MQWSAFVLGATAAVAARAAVVPALRVKFDRDIRRLNAGDHRPMLSAYAADAVLRFAPGAHRFAGVWTGRAAIEQFLQEFTGAGLQGEIKEIATSGPPWAMRLWARFDDRSVGADGVVLYENRAVLVLRTRWGRVVEQDDFLADTAPIEALERALLERGIEPAARP
jgi:ketosteroid isomerase-like protein